MYPLRKHLLIVLLFLVPRVGRSQPVVYSKEAVDRMEMTIAYYIIQMNSIEAIAAKFPKLATSAQDALREWNNEFYPTIQEIDRILLANDSASWIPKKDMMVMKYSRADYSRMKEKDAQEYIFEVNKRAVGKIESPVLETLLEFNNQYIKEPDREFTERYVQAFLTKSIKNAQGLDMKLLVPQSWKSSALQELEPGVVQKFTSRCGDGNLHLIVYIQKSKAQADPKKALAKPEMIKNICSQEDIIEFQGNTFLDNSPAAHIHYLLHDKNHATGEIYALTYNEFTIRLVFEIRPLGNDPDQVAADYEKNKVLIRKIKDSLVILSKWNQKK